MVNASAFEGNPSNRIVLPQGCAAIDSRAFASCASLWEIVVPASVTTIADDAFAGSEEVTIISPSASVRAWAKAHGIASREG